MLLDMDAPKLIKDDPAQSLKNVQKWLLALVDGVNECLCSIDTGNFADNTVEDITAPVAKQIGDLSGNVTQLAITAEGLTTRVANTEGAVTTAQQTADGAMITAQNAAGQAASVAVTVNGLGVTTAGGTTFSTGDHVKSGTIEGAILDSDNGVSEVVIGDGEIRIKSSGAYFSLAKLRYDNAEGKVVLEAMTLPLKVKANDISPSAPREAPFTSALTRQGRGTFISARPTAAE